MEGRGPAVDGAAAALMRSTCAREAEPIGTVPPPASLKGAAKTVLKALQGEKASVFIDKLGERLAFERIGARLYEVVLIKAEAYPTWPGGPSREELLEIQRDELSHFGLLQSCIEKLGADPTAMTPSADIAANLSKGIPQVLADPRTDLRQCLEGRQRLLGVADRARAGGGTGRDGARLRGRPAARRAAPRPRQGMAQAGRRCGPRRETIAGPTRGAALIVSEPLPRWPFPSRRCSPSRPCRGCAGLRG